MNGLWGAMNIYKVKCVNLKIFKEKEKLRAAQSYRKTTWDFNRSAEIIYRMISKKVNRRSTNSAWDTVLLKTQLRSILLS